MNVHNSDLAHRLFNGLSDGLSPSVIDSRFHGIYYFPDLIEKPPEKVDALTDLMTRENERMGKMIKKENRMAQARRNRDKQVANEFSLKQQQLDSNRKREIIQVGQRLVEREMQVAEAHLARRVKQENVRDSLMKIIEEEALCKLHMHESTALKQIQSRAHKQIRDQEKYTNQTWLDKIKHDTSMHHVKQSARKRRFMLENELATKEKKIKEYMKTRKQLRETLLQKRYEIEMERYKEEISCKQPTHSSKPPSRYESGKYEIQSSRMLDDSESAYESSPYSFESPYESSSPHSLESSIENSYSHNLGETMSLDENSSTGYHQNYIRNHCDFYDTESHTEYSVDSAPREAATAQNQWYYIDEGGLIQGPFDNQRMRTWHMRGMFPDDLPICNIPTGTFLSLGQVYPDINRAFMQ